LFATEVKLNPFAQISDAGRKFYDLHQDLNISQNFSDDFLLYWLLAVLLFYPGRKYRLYNIPLRQLKKFRPRIISFLRTILLLFPALFVIYLLLFRTGGVPHFEDEFSYLYQARALGHFKYPGIKVPPELTDTMQGDVVKINREGILTGMYPIGLPLFLTPLSRFGLEAFFPPLITLINTWLLFALFKKIFSRRRIIPYLLTASSIYFVYYSCLFLTQSLSLTMVSLILLRRLEHKNIAIDYLIAGLLFITRPGDGAIMFLALFIYQLRFLPLNQLWHPSPYLSAIAAFIVHIWNNRLLAGAFFLNPYQALFPFLGYGFGAKIGLTEPLGFNLIEAFKNFASVLLSLNEALFGWPFMSLLPLILFPVLLSGRFSKRSHHLQKDFLFFCLLLSLIWTAFYFCYFFPGNMVGPRFHYPLLPIMIIFATASISAFPELRLLVCTFCLIGFLRMVKITDENGALAPEGGNPNVSSLLNGGTVFSFPFQEFNLQKGSRIYIIPEYTHMYKPFFYSFYHHNDPFRGILHSISEKDFRKHPDFFREKFGDRLQMLGLKNTTE
jgi:hypothetical protein